jgi:Flp pilus assembly protein protease CpaA
MTEVLLFVGGVVFGALVVLAVLLLRRREARSVARELVAETEAQKIRTSKRPRPGARLVRALSLKP